jgi:hypothetical protein
MHRILLYALVLGLLYLAWDARRDAVLAASPAAGEEARSASRELLASAPPRTAPQRAHPRNGLQGRLEARVGARREGSDTGELAQTAPSEGQLASAEAEAWMRAHFPEGSVAEGDRTAGESSPAAGEETTVPARGDEASEEPAGGDPIHVASLARIECLDGSAPGWCGLLDLALEPVQGQLARPRRGDRQEAWIETAWISDTDGKLLARVAALDGLGLMLDPTWPWMARARHLMWTQAGPVGLSSRQYRLVLEGSQPGTAWTGRLVLIPLPLSRAR